MSSQQIEMKRWHHIGFIILVGILMAGITLSLLWSSAFAGFHVGGAGNCGNFSEAVRLAEDEDIVAQMVPARDSGSAVITKNLRLSGSWVPSVNCDENNQYFTATSDYLAYGFQYGAPFSRTQLYSNSGPVLELGDVSDPGFPNLDKLIVEHFILTDTFATDGAGIHGIISGSAEVLLDNVWLQNNDVSNDGGGIHLEVRDSSNLLIDEGGFFSNTADNHGGGLYVELREGSRLAISNTNFFNNQALFAGGFEIHIYDSSQLSIINSQIQNNDTNSSNGDGGGGQIILHGGSVVLDGVTIEQNEAGNSGGSGGGLFLQMDGGQAVIKNSRFSDNNANSGGGLYVDSVGSDPTSVTIMNTHFENNAPNAYQFTQSGSGALTTLIQDENILLPAVVKAAAQPIETARITNITLDASFNYIVAYETDNFTPAVPGVHLHFFFDTVPPDQAGVPGSGPWILYGGSSPFTQYSFDDRPFGPYGAEKMCVLVANPDHSVRQGTGNCFKLP